MNKFLLTITIFNLCIHCFAEPLSPNDLIHLQKQKTTEHILYECYTKSDKGPAHVFGYHFDTFYTKDVSFILAIFGAVGGNRGGYGIAAFGLGYTLPLTDTLCLDARALCGSGGGGGVPAGGGFALEGQIGFTWQVIPNIGVEAHYGYLRFPTGTFESPIFNVGVNYSYNRIVLPFE